jgi:hypothetical protein
MKKLFALSSLMLFLLTVATAQPIPEKNKDGYVNGRVTLPDNTVITGTIKDNIRKKGEVIILNEGKKSKYLASDINSVEIGASHYITNNNTFFELVWESNSITLYRKANNPSAIQYNGTEPVVVNKSVGEIDDLFVKKTGDGTFYHLTSKNIKEVIGTSCPSCVIAIAPSDFGLEAVKKALSSCDCK